MAVGAARSNPSMIELSASEASSTFMTGFTSFCGWYMVAWLSFSCCTVMAAGTACSNASVIHFATFKAGGRAVAGLTGRGRRYMVS